MERKILVITAIWCSSCLIMNKNLNKLQNKFKQINIDKLDYDLDEEEVKKYNIGKILPVIIIKDEYDREIDRLVGEKTYKEIAEFIEKGVKR